MRKKKRFPTVCAGLLLAACCTFETVGDEATNATPHQAKEESARPSLFDPEDGMLDMSAWLGSAKGFFPVPIIITEPAVGYGAGVTLLFLHDSIKNRAEQVKERNPDGTPKRLPPPSVSGVFGAATENGTWAAGGFHRGIWKDDTIRYTGVLAYLAPNFDYYGTPGGPLPIDKIPISLEGGLFLQQLNFRIKDSPFFAGLGYTYFNAEASLDTEQTLPPIFGEGQRTTSGGLISELEYDTRDNPFTPNHGYNGSARWTHFDTWLASDNQFELILLKNRYWYPLAENLVIGLRADGEFSGGDVPFYMLPYIQMRGIPAMRYQADYVVSAEAELRWDFQPRWSLVGFAGAGWVADDSLSSFSDSETYPAGGFGFRYLFSTVFQLRAGLDFAFSEGNQAFYITAGNGWNRF